MNVLRIHILACFASYLRRFLPEGSYVIGEEFQAQVKTRCEIINFSPLIISVSNMIACELSLFFHNTIHDVITKHESRTEQVELFQFGLVS